MTLASCRCHSDLEFKSWSWLNPVVDLMDDSSIAHAYMRHSCQSIPNVVSPSSSSSNVRRSCIPWFLLYWRWHYVKVRFSWAAYWIAPAQYSLLSAWSSGSALISIVCSYFVKFFSKPSLHLVFASIFAPPASETLLHQDGLPFLFSHTNCCLLGSLKYLQLLIGMLALWSNRVEIQCHMTGSLRCYTLLFLSYCWAYIWHHIL